MDRLTSMSVFVSAADHGSFAAAADANGLSATMVGKHVQSLERRLGVRLINRTTRSQSLTEFGRAYYDRCRQILADTEAAELLASDHLNKPQGKLRVAAPGLLGRLCVAPILLEMAQGYPSLKLELSLSDELVDILAGGFDLAVRTGAIADRSGLMMRRLGRHRMVVCGSPAYLDAHGPPQSIDDLRRHMTVMYSRPGWSPAWLFLDDAGTPVEVRPPYRVGLNDLAAVTDAAMLGAGLAWIPSWLARPHLDSGRLREVLTTQRPYIFDNYALWPEAKYLPLRTRLALDVLASRLESRLQ